MEVGCASVLVSITEQAKFSMIGSKPVGAFNKGFWKIEVFAGIGRQTSDNFGVPSFVSSSPDGIFNEHFNTLLDDIFEIIHLFNFFS